MRWRPTLVYLHRDIGYLCLGITIAYAVSGIAVNHRQHWDYNFSSEHQSYDVGSPAVLLGAPPDDESAIGLAQREQSALVSALGRAMGRDKPPRRVYWRSPERLTLVFQTGERDVVDYLPGTGRAERLQRKPRTIFRELNFLHLNEPKGLWTWVADLYAVALLFLGLSGALIVKGRKGLRGRGGWLAAIGFLVVLLGLLLSGGPNR